MNPVERVELAVHRTRAQAKAEGFEGMVYWLGVLADNLEEQARAYDEARDVFLPRTGAVAYGTAAPLPEHPTIVCETGVANAERPS